MRNLWEAGLLQRIAALMLAAILLGISPVPREVLRAAREAGRDRQLKLPLGTARNLAVVAGHQPWRVDLWEQAGNYALEGNDPGTAIAYYKKAAGLGALSHAGYLRFGDAYAETGNLYTASQVWEAALRIYGPSAESLGRLAEAQRESQDYPGLATTLKALINLPSPDFNAAEQVDLVYELGMLLAAQDPGSAPPYLLQAAELDPARGDAGDLAFTIQRALPQGDPAYCLLASGRKLADLGKWELAATAFQGVLDIQPAYGEAWAFLGEARQHLPDSSSEAAYQALEKAIEIDPASLPANLFTALYWRRAGEPERALTYLAAAAEIDPNNPDILVDLGATTAIAGDLDSANRHYLEAIELTSREPAYLRAYVDFCIQYHYDLEGTALPTAREIMRSDPDDPASMDTMGQVLFRLGDLHTAERFYLQAISRDPSYAPAHLHLGLVYNLEGKTDLANASFARAIALAPGSPAAILAERFYQPPAQP